MRYLNEIEKIEVDFEKSSEDGRYLFARVSFPSSSYGPLISYDTITNTVNSIEFSKEYCKHGVTITDKYRGNNGYFYYILFIQFLQL